MQSEATLFGLSPSKTRYLVVLLIASLGIVSIGLGRTMLLNSDLESRLRSASNKVTSSILISSLSSLSNSYLYIIQEEAITLRDIRTIMRQADDIEAQASILTILDPAPEGLWNQLALLSYDVNNFMYRIDQEVYSVGVVPKDSMTLTSEQVTVFLELRTNINAITSYSFSLRAHGGGFNNTAISEISELVSEFHELTEESYNVFNLSSDLKYDGA